MGDRSPGKKVHQYNIASFLYYFIKDKAIISGQFQFFFIHIDSYCFVCFFLSNSQALLFGSMAKAHTSGSWGKKMIHSIPRATTTRGISVRVKGTEKESFTMLVVRPTKESGRTIESMGRLINVNHRVVSFISRGENQKPIQPQIHSNLHEDLEPYISQIYQFCYWCWQALKL